MNLFQYVSNWRWSLQSYCWINLCSSHVPHGRVAKCHTPLGAAITLLNTRCCSCKVSVTPPHKRRENHSSWLLKKWTLSNIFSSLCCTILVSALHVQTLIHWHNLLLKVTHNKSGFSFLSGQWHWMQCDCDLEMNFLLLYRVEAICLLMSHVRLPLHE